MNKTQITGAAYSRGAIILHWLIAVLIVLNFVAAWISEDMPKEDAAQVMANHKAIGLTILLLSVLRLVWRFVHKPPPLLESLKAWEAALAKVVHWLFYFLIIATPITGWGMASAGRKGEPVSWFGIIDIPALPVAHDRETAGIFHESHEVLATLMIFLLVLHVAAALKHQFLDRDATMARMLPFLRR